MGKFSGRANMMGRALMAGSARGSSQNSNGDFSNVSTMMQKMLEDEPPRELNSLMGSRPESTGGHPIMDLAARAGIDPAPFMKSGKIQELLDAIHSSGRIGSDGDMETIDQAAQQFGVRAPWEQNQLMAPRR